MKRLFGKKVRKVELPGNAKTPVDHRPGVYSDALVWAVNRLNAAKAQPAAGF